MLLGHYVEMKATIGATKSLKKLAEFLPSVAHLLSQDKEINDVDVQQLEKGDSILVKPGEKIPVDGKIIDGASTVDQSALTGESQPIDKNVEDHVIGGSINGSGALTIRIEKNAAHSYFSQVIKLVEATIKSKSKMQNLADRAASWLTIIALRAGVATFAWVADRDREVLCTS